MIQSVCEKHPRCVVVWEDDITSIVRWRRECPVCRMEQEYLEKVEELARRVQDQESE